MFSIGRCSGLGKRRLAIVSQSELILQRSAWKRNGKRVVCVAGAFDLLHPGHIRVLEQARGLGDILVVALQSDASVKLNHHSDNQHAGVRPITPAAERAEILAVLAAVDYVVEFEDSTPREFFRRFAPDVVVQGGETGSQESAFLDDDAIRAAGGRVVRVAREPGYSTSFLLERISQLHA